MKPFEILDCPADTRLKVQGHDLEELFQNAVLGLNAILTGDKISKQAGEMEKVGIEAVDVEMLLVNFLNEILRRSVTNKRVYNRVKFLRFSPKNLEAQIFGVGVAGFQRNVRAVSYHNIKIEQNKRGIWQIELALDV